MTSGAWRELLGACRDLMGMGVVGANEGAQ